VTNTALPGEWHPAYEQYRNMLGRWLSDPTEPDRFMVAFPRALRFDEAFADPSFDLPSYRSFTLTRVRCFGAAPYVGRPFVYMWRAGIDELGRAVATETAEIVYTEAADGSSA
jgi:hypothetical protein